MTPGSEFTCLVPQNAIIRGTFQKCMKFVNKVMETVFYACKGFLPVDFLKD
jgi:hypothetical protein